VPVAIVIPAEFVNPVVVAKIAMIAVFPNVAGSRLKKA
jgi:hypothetical protein